MFKNKIQQAAMFQQYGQFDLAAEIYQSIIKVNAHHFDALQLLGALEGQRGNFEISLTLLDRALNINRNSWVAFSNRAGVKLQLGQADAALKDAERARHYNPQSPEIHDTLGTIELALDRPERALTSFERSLALRPCNPSVLVNYAAALKEVGRVEEASARVRYAIDHGARVYPQAHVVLGNILVAQDRAREAIEHYQYALAVAPNFLPAYVSLGAAWLFLNEVEQAVRAFAAAQTMLRSSPASPAQQIDSRHYGGRDEAIAVLDFYEGMAHLVGGNLRKGFELYEARWTTNRGAFSQRYDWLPRWQGTSLRGKSILLHSEQGLGDTLQFVRYVPVIAAMAGRVVLAVQPALVSLFSQFQSVCTVMSDDDLASVKEVTCAYDFCCPLMSVPFVMGQNMTSLDGAPYLKALGMRREYWTHRINRSGNLSVGLVWQGSRGHQNDRKRSIPFDTFSQVLIDGVDFHCLQVESLPDPNARRSKGKAIRFWEEEIQNFTDTAEIISLLDLVITVDTSVAHLAGAMGKSVWLLVTYSPDWRWFLDRADSPWYQKTRIFRQPTPGDWSSVLATVKEALRTYRRLQTKAPKLADGQGDFLV
ncbi:tetratricopeptide repeat protein [Burkholderia gladioli]|uniref:tetratricopeptide repeat protein n=1 Tax=Burkholderia gladioli TaxID=28095 RepID=UPI003F797D3D